MAVTSASSGHLQNFKIDNSIWKRKENFFKQAMICYAFFHSSWLCPAGRAMFCCFAVEEKEEKMTEQPGIIENAKWIP